MTSAQDYVSFFYFLNPVPLVELLSYIWHRSIFFQCLHESKPEVEGLKVMVE